MFNPIYIDATVRQRQAEWEELIQRQELLREARGTENEYLPIRSGHLKDKTLLNLLKMVLSNLTVPFK